jgi:hypothetical protein
MCFSKDVLYLQVPVDMNIINSSPDRKKIDSSSNESINHVIKKAYSSSQANWPFSLRPDPKTMAIMVARWPTGFTLPCSYTLGRRFLSSYSPLCR